MFNFRKSKMTQTAGVGRRPLSGQNGYYHGTFKSLDEVTIGCVPVSCISSDKSTRRIIVF